MPVPFTKYLYFFRSYLCQEYTRSRRARQERLFRSGWRMKVHLSVQPLESSFPGAVFFPDLLSPLLAQSPVPNNEDKRGGSVGGTKMRGTAADDSRWHKELTDTYKYAPQSFWNKRIHAGQIRDGPLRHLDTNTYFTAASCLDSL